MNEQYKQLFLFYGAQCDDECSPDCSTRTGPIDDDDDDDCSSTVDDDNDDDCSSADDDDDDDDSASDARGFRSVQVLHMPSM